MKGKQEVIVFLLYSLWHYFIIQALISSTESKFKIIVSVVGLLIIDLYLFFNHYNKNQ